MSTRTASLWLLLLATSCFSLATILQPKALAWSQRGRDSVLKVVLGEGRRLFANHFFTKADVYFHSGYYPTIFDRAAAPPDTHEMSGQSSQEEEEHEKEEDFLGRPKDWVERIGRQFIVSKHTHLEGGKQREILPWLKLSAELDPQQVDTYTVAAFWLRSHLGKPKEAEEFLREGLRANPNSYEILFALGRLYNENYHDAARARNVWELALRRWRQQDEAKRDADRLMGEQLLVHLGRLEEEQGNVGRAIQYLEEAKKLSPAPVALQKQIDEMRAKLGSGTNERSSR